jgi:hypothetical protein
VIRAIVIALALADVAHAQGTQQRVERAPPLTHQGRCDLYRGTSAGNAEALIELRLCTQGDGSVEGVRQSSSASGGWSRREVVGQWEGDHFIGHEVRFLENHPAPGWRFCLVDRLRLTRTADRLEGSFVATACDDRGIFNLTRVEETAPVVARPQREQEPSMFGCAAAPRGDRGCVLLVLLALGVGTRRARR